MKDNKDIQYKIFKSEACGHTIEYKMVKKEHELEKARVDEGLSSKQKKQKRFERNIHQLEGKKPWQPHKRGDESLKEERRRSGNPGERSSKMIILRHDLEAKHGKKPSNQDLEYPMASSEKEECLCKDCDCDKKGTDQKVREIKGIKYDEEHKSDKDREKFKRPIEKSEKFYIQKIQELRKNVFKNVNYQTGKDLKKLTQKNQDEFDRKYKSGSKSNLGEYVMRDAPKGTERATQGVLNNMTGFLPTQPATATQPAATATQPAATAQKYDMKNPYKVENAKNFKDAFNQARKETGGGGNVFEYNGKKYHTYTQDEFKNPDKAGIQPDNKFYKDWQARKDTTGPNAYYANKMNPAAAPAAQTPAAGKAANPQSNPNTANQQADGQPAAKTPAAQNSPIEIARFRTGKNDTGYTKDDISFEGNTRKIPTNIPGVNTTKLLPTNSPDHVFNPSKLDKVKFPTGETVELPSPRGLIQTDSSVKSPKTGYVGKKNMA